MARTGAIVGREVKMFHRWVGAHNGDRALNDAPMFRSLTKVVSTLALLAVLLAPSQAGASLIQDIYVGSGDEGYISFPSESGTEVDGFTFSFMGFTEGDITSLSWTLGEEWEVVELSLEAFMGDSPCNKGKSPCEYSGLTLTALTYSVTAGYCEGTQPGAGCSDETNYGSVGYGDTNGDPEIPEPSTLALFGIGLAGLGFMTRRRRNRRRQT